MPDRERVPLGEIDRPMRRGQEGTQTRRGASVTREAALWRGRGVPVAAWAVDRGGNVDKGDAVDEWGTVDEWRGDR